MRAIKMMIKTGKILMMNLAVLSKSGRMDLWSSLARGFLKARIKAGRTVIEPMTPRTTPLAMTRPRSRPSVNVMKQRAMNPATVVAEEPMTELRVDLMARSMAFAGSLVLSRFSRKE